MNEIAAPALMLNRRRVLQGGLAVGLGLLIGFRLPTPSQAAAPAAPVPVAPNAFLRIATDGVVTLLSKHTEYGQGIYTGLATLVAEELDADWTQMRVEGAPANEKLYANLRIRGQQHTGGSTSIANSWMQMRTVGATARAMLVRAAAKAWRVPESEITVSKGVIAHAASKRSAGFGEFAAKAAALPMPTNVPLKDPKTFTLIGTKQQRVDAAGMVNGTTQYVMDWHEPGMRVAVVQHPPRFGATVAAFDDSIAKAVPGVTHIVKIPTGVAVVADSFWAAKRGRDALQVTWDESKAEKRSTRELFAHYRELAKTPGKPALAQPRGDVEKALAEAVTRVSATYELPYVTHAPMEPMSVVCKLSAGGCDIWTSSRNLTADHKVAATITGLAQEQIRIHLLHAGGAFGRRGPADNDYKAEAVAIAKALGGDGVAVKVIWTREDDIRSGMYRPMVHHALEAGLDANGTLIAWRHRIVGQAMLKNGATDVPYAIPNFAVETHEPKSPVSTSPLRSVDHTHTGFATEVFLDEIAQASGQDPLALRRALLADNPRLLNVVNIAAEKAGWGEELPAGRGRGIATHFTMGSWAAHVADVSVGKDGQVKVERIICAADCGLAINPDVIEAQVNGGTVFGLSVAMNEAITLNEGRVEQSNFDDYRILRMAEMPKIEVHIVPSMETPTGVGELGVPPVAPAVTGAIFAATGKRIRTLPIARSLIEA